MPLISSSVTPLNESRSQAADSFRRLSLKEKTVEKYHVADEVIKIHKLFEDSDISRFPEVQEASAGTLLAAYHVLVLQDVEPTEQNLVKALRAFLLYAMDESTLANSEDQHFMDLCDERRFSAGLMDRITQEVSDRVIHNFRKRGFHVVEIRLTRGWDEDECGFYVFTDAAV